VGNGRGEFIAGYGYGIVDLGVEGFVGGGGLVRVVGCLTLVLLVGMGHGGGGWFVPLEQFGLDKSNSNSRFWIYLVS